MSSPKSNLNGSSSDLLVDFENHFSDMEDSYKNALEEIIKSRDIKNISIKTYISYFIFTRLMRSHQTWNRAVNIFANAGLEKYEMFLNIKEHISNPEKLLQALMPILSSKWTLYAISRKRFPLTDASVLIDRYYLMIPLSPDLLLEVNLKKRVPVEYKCIKKTRIGVLKYWQFKKVSITSASREIIFGDKKILRQWQNTGFFKRRLRSLFIKVD